MASTAPGDGRRTVKIPSAADLSLMASISEAVEADATTLKMEYIEAVFDPSTAVLSVPMPKPTATIGTPKPKARPPMTKSDLWKLIDSVSKVSRRILLFGPPGTGKTYAATQTAEGQALYTITMTEDTPAAELRGHFVPRDREFVWMDGPAVSAWRQGARLVVNEIDHASADALTFLFAIMDDPQFAALTLPTGELIRPAEGFQVICTMNGVPEDLPLALQDRLPVTIEVNELNPNALLNLPEDLRTVAGNTGLARNPEQRFSIRLWMEYANLRTALKDERRAAQAIFGKRADEALAAIGIQAATADLRTDEDY